MEVLCFASSPLLTPEYRQAIIAVPEQPENKGEKHGTG